MAGSARISKRDGDPVHRYLIALGSNRWHPHHGAPRAVLRAATASLAGAGLTILHAAPVIASRPLGPSQRTYANGAVVVATPLAPLVLLDLLQAIEARFGRRRRGQRWGSRVLDLDIVLWSGGPWADRRLTLPHREAARRPFVLTPACAIARHWRDPRSGFTIGQLHARLTAPRALPKRP